ncbi:hypothetical protein [Larkinella soli]|nr:hypothetical protein [Larkinella soli]
MPKSIPENAWAERFDNKPLIINILTVKLFGRRAGMKGAIFPEWKAVFPK